MFAEKWHVTIIIKNRHADLPRIDPLRWLLKKASNKVVLLNEMGGFERGLLAKSQDELFIGVGYMTSDTGHGYYENWYHVEEVEMPDRLNFRLCLGEHVDDHAFLTFLDAGGEDACAEPLIL